VAMALGHDGMIYVVSRSQEYRCDGKRITICTIDEDYIGEFGRGVLTDGNGDLSEDDDGMSDDSIKYPKLPKDDDYEGYFKFLTNKLIEVESEFGNEVEGYVFFGCEKCPIKVQKSNQLDKEARMNLKKQFKDDNLFNESLYWTKVKEVAKNVISKLKNKTIEGKLSEASKIIRDYKNLPVHPKKSPEIVKDDIILTLKLDIIRELAEKYSLVQGKFRIFTKKHKELIEKALKENDGVVIAIINNRKTPKAIKELKRKVIEKCFSKEIVKGKVDVIEASTGNLNTILNKTVNIVDKLYTGTDRVKEYQEYIEKANREINVIELARDDSSISATKIINNIEDKKYFQENTSKCTWEFYNDYLKNKEVIGNLK